MKKIICLSLSLSLIFTSNIVFAQKKTRTLNKLKRNSDKTKYIKQSSTKTTTPLSQSKENILLSCSERYNLCMDNVCSNKQGIRYMCATSIDSFETIERDGEKFRIGSDLYTFAKSVCSDTLKSCELKERNHIETTYKAQINEDLLMKKYFDIMNAESDETQTTVLEEYTSCMEPICGNNFSDCMTITNVERRAPTCESILSKSSKPLSVKKMFYDKITEIRSELCKGKGGYIDFDTKICKVRVSFGTAETILAEDGKTYLTGKIHKEVASRIFNVGEIIECTQTYFNTSNTIKPNLIEGIKDTIFGGIRAVAGIVVAVVGVIASIYTGGSQTPMIMNGASMVCKGAGQILTGAVKINTDVKNPNSACFVNGTYAAPQNTFFRIDFNN